MDPQSGVITAEPESLGTCDDINVRRQLDLHCGRRPHPDALDQAGAATPVSLLGPLGAPFSLTKEWKVPLCLFTTAGPLELQARSMRARCDASSAPLTPFSVISPMPGAYSL